MPDTRKTENRVADRQPTRGLNVILGWISLAGFVVAVVLAAFIFGGDDKKTAADGSAPAAGQTRTSPGGR
jgi:hypothetical protein